MCLFMFSKFRIINYRQWHPIGFIDRKFNLFCFVQIENNGREWLSFLVLFLLRHAVAKRKIVEPFVGHHQRRINFTHKLSATIIKFINKPKWLLSLSDFEIFVVAFGLELVPNFFLNRLDAHSLKRGKKTGSIVKMTVHKIYFSLTHSTVETFFCSFGPEKREFFFVDNEKEKNLFDLGKVEQIDAEKNESPETKRSLHKQFSIEEKSLICCVFRWTKRKKSYFK